MNFSKIIRLITIASLLFSFDVAEAKDSPSEPNNPALPYEKRSSVTTQTEIILEVESFESSFPEDLWSVLDDDGTTNGEYYWGKDDYKAIDTNSAWCARSGANGMDPETNNYANNMRSWMIYGPFDLSDAVSADFSFYLWLDSEEDYDKLKYGASSNGTSFAMLSASGQYNWARGTFDLTTAGSQGDLTGDSSVWIGFLFESDSSITGKGAFIDNILLKKDVEVTLQTPVLDEPGNGNETIAPTFSWTSSGTFDGFQIEIDDNSDFSSPIIQDWTNEFSYQPSDVLPPDTYYWRVRATYYDSVGLWSDIWHINHIGIGTPNLYEPSNYHETSEAYNIFFDWSDVPGADMYIWEVYTDPGLTNLYAWWFDEYSHYLANWEFEQGTYYWHVQAYIYYPEYPYLESGNWSEVYQLSITGEPVAPGNFNKLSPPDGEPNISINPTLSWQESSGATSFEYCYDTTNDNACSSWISVGLETSVIISGLTPSTPYYWHVRANNSSGTTYSNGGSSTAFWDFTTASSSTLGTFNKISPNDGANGVSINPTFSWESCPGAIAYFACYDTIDDDLCNADYFDLPASELSATASGLEPNTTYYWHVFATDGEDVAYSDNDTSFWSFTTGTGTSSEITLRFFSNGQEIVNGDATPSESEGTDFGSVEVGSSSDTRWFKVWSTGTAELNLTGDPRAAINGPNASDFIITSQPVATIGAIYNSTQFDITFSPTGSGLRTATVTIDNDDPDENPYIFTIQGMGFSSAIPFNAFLPLILK